MVFSRCKSKLVILSNEEYFERFVSKDHHSNNNALKIPISGIFVTLSNNVANSGGANIKTHD